MSDSDTVVRAAKKLASIIQAAKPKAKVYSHWILGQGAIGESFPDMLSELEDEWVTVNPKYVPWPHAYVIGEDSSARERRTGQASFRDLETFRLWAFYGFMKGDESKNSSHIASVHWKDVQNAISKATKLQQVDNIVQDPDGVPEMVQHGEWQITQKGVYWMNNGTGKNKVHIAQGELLIDTRIILNATTTSG